MGRISACGLALALIGCGGSTSTARDSGIVDATPDEEAPDVNRPDSASDATATDASDASYAPSSEASLDATGDAPSGDAGPTVVFSGLIVSSGTSSFPLPGAKVCVAQTTNCSTTDSQGSFSLQIPANAQVAITIQCTGYTNVLVPIVTNNLDQTGWEIGTLNAAATTSNYQAAGATYPDPSTAFLAAYASTSSGQSGHAGVTFSYVPAPNHGPVYPNATGADDDAGATSTSTWGEGMVTFPASASQVVVTFEPTTLTCTSNFGGWPSSGANSVLVPLLGGFETHVGQVCTP
jgi:hypothetical protein